MKRLEISRLMDEYQDGEFFPEGGSTADVETVKNMVLAKAGPAKKRKRIPTVTKVLLAAALAVGCVLCIAAALPIFTYQQVDGSSVYVHMDGNGNYMLIGYDVSEFQEPIVLEDGRLWLTVGDQRTDITDLIDEETPYIVEGTDPDSGLKCYLIVGGTPEDFGREMWTELPKGDYIGGGWNCYDTMVIIDGVEYNYNDLTEEQLAQGYTSIYDVNKAWCQNGREMLHLWD